MKNHIIFKFIAIILCAAALLGAAACGGGVALLTGFGLYDKTVDEFYQANLNQRGEWFAHDVTVRYSDVVLGGMPIDFLDREYGSQQHFDPWYTYYEILDADGNPLPVDTSLSRSSSWAHPQAAPEGAVTYTFAVPAGKHAHLVSSKAASETAMTEPVDSEPADFTEPAPAQTEAPIELQAPVEETEDAGIAALAETAEDAVPAEEGAPDEEEEASDGEAEPAGDGEALPEEDPEALSEDPVDAEEEPPAGEPGEEAGEPEPTPRSGAADDEPENEIAAEKLDEEVTVEAGEEAAAKAALPTEAPTVPQETVDVLSIYDIPEETEPVLVNGRPLSEYQVYTDRYLDLNLGEEVTITYVLLDSPAYTVKLHLLPGAMEEDAFVPLLRVLRGYRNMLLPGLAVCLLLFAALAVYLCCAAGRKPHSDEVRAGGLNRLPLELYLGAVGLSVGAGCLYLAEGGANYLLQQNLTVAIATSAGLAYAVCLVFVGFCFALAAQLKTPGWFWAKNSLCGWCLRLAIWAWHLLLKAIVWLANGLEKKVLPFLGWSLKKLWLGLKNGCTTVFGWCERFLSLLPLTWQWLVVCLILLMFFLISIAAGSVFLLLLTVFASIAAIIYGSHAFGVLMETTRRMSKGDLHAKADDKLLIGCFRDFAKTLNALASVAVVAAQKQLKSERMKTELITNVSHDIKTPLTSIISYADLLQKPHTPEEEQQYLEVLSRQSMQLKKLIEDLIEMSKASTGNLSVDITQVDAVEAMNQALGEFADKLDAAMLTPVFRHSDDAAPMMADGKLVWRVLHNLLSNAVKYALPGTRLYIDMLCLEGKVILSMKNVSRDELNVDAEELMERFVRGDGSRNTEGSGLGLNIAKSMMELQHGSLQLLVDGDLFKVTLIFPGA